MSSNVVVGRAGITLAMLWLWGCTSDGGEDSNTRRKTDVQEDLDASPGNADEERDDSATIIPKTPLQPERDASASTAGEIADGGAADNDDDAVPGNTPADDEVSPAEPAPDEGAADEAAPEMNDLPNDDSSDLVDDQQTVDDMATDDVLVDDMAATDAADDVAVDDTVVDDVDDTVVDEMVTDDVVPPDPVVLPSCDAPLTYAKDDTAIAQALAQLIWNDVPDFELSQAASNGQLSTSEQVRAQLERMLNSPLAAQRLGDFGPWWFGGRTGPRPVSNKDPAIFPQFDAQLSDDLLETSRLFTQSLIQADETLGTLLTADYAYANDAVGEIYGMTGLGSDFVRVELDPTQRAGLFTQPYFLSLFGISNPSPTLRGKWLEERLLCFSVPPPPPGIDIQLPEPDGGSNREAYEAMVSEPACLGCHQLITYPGFIFENYDALGSYQTVDNGVPVNAQTEVYVDNSLVPFDDAVQMMHDLADRESVSDCFTRNWFTFLMGRSPTHVSEIGATQLPCADGTCATVGDYALSVAQCAGPSGAERNLRALTTALVSSPLLLEDTFQCGPTRCLTQLEYCYSWDMDGQPGADDYYCLPDDNPTSACEDGCVCQATADGGWQVDCP